MVISRVGPKHCKSVQHDLVSNKAWSLLMRFLHLRTSYLAICIEIFHTNNSAMLEKFLLHKYFIIVLLLMLFYYKLQMDSKSLAFGHTPLTTIELLCGSWQSVTRTKIYTTWIMPLIRLVIWTNHIFINPQGLKSHAISTHLWAEVSVSNSE